VSLNPAVHVDPIGTLLFPLIALLTNVPVLGWAKPVPVNITRLRGHWKRKYMLIAAAGPASNVVLAIVASILLHVVPVTGGLEEATLAPLAQFLYQAVLLNVLLAVFNMVPIPPLDGGNVLAGVLRGPIAETYEQLRPYGFMILYGLMFTGILTMMIARPPNSYCHGCCETIQFTLLSSRFSVRVHLHGSVRSSISVLGVRADCQSPNPDHEHRRRTGRTNVEHEHEPGREKTEA
jgi:Zn-dependent protease